MAWTVERLCIPPGPLCAGEALLEARTQASVAFFKLGPHSATLRPEFGGPEKSKVLLRKRVGSRGGAAEYLRLRG